jgi:hypothetical protein
MALISKSEFARVAGVSAAAIGKAVKKQLVPALVRKDIDTNHPVAIEYVKIQEEKRSVKPAGDSKASKKEPDQKAAVKKKVNSKADSKSKSVDVGDDSEQISVDVQVKSVVTGDGFSIDDMLQNAIQQETNVDKFEVVRSFVHKVMVNHLPDDIRDMADMTLNQLIDMFGRDVDFVIWLKATKEIELVSERRIKNARSLGELVDKDIVKKGLIAPLDGVFRSLLTDGSATLEKEIRNFHDLKKTPEECRLQIEEIIGRFISPAKSRIERSVKALDVKY